MSDAVVKELEVRKAEVLERIKEVTENIKVERTGLAFKIFEIEATLEARKMKDRMPAVETDIYDVESILAAADESKSIGELKNNVTQLYKAYSLSPYSDKNKAEEILKLLDELNAICIQLDSYYSAEVEKAMTVLEKAKMDIREMQKKRLSHQTEVFSANRMLCDTAGFDIIGQNKLNKHNVNPVTTGVIFGLANKRMSGQQIVEMTKKAIINEMETTQRVRTASAGKEPKIIGAPFLVSGESVAVFGSKYGLQKNQLKEFVRNIFK